MKKIKRLVSLIMFCLCALIPFSVHAETMSREEYAKEQSRQLSEMQGLLRESGVGFAEGYDGMPVMARTRDTIYTKVLKANIGAIDVVDYQTPAPDGTPWTVLEHWKEGMLGSGSGEALYCANPMTAFRAGYKSSVPASTYYNQSTIQMIAAMFYYYDHYMCIGIDNNYDYLMKQCAVWWVLNEVHHWYPNAVVETGNDVQCSKGHWLATHKGEYQNSGMAWARKNYQYFSDAYGVIYQGEGQPLSRWGGTYTPHGYAKLRKVSANAEMTNENHCYSLAGAEFGVYSSPTLSGTSRAGTFTTDEKGESGTMTLLPGTYYLRELKAPKGYALSTQTREFQVVSGKTEEIVVTDLPQSNPIGLLLQKVDAETGNNVAQGSGTFQGAEFTVKYYLGLWEKDKNPALLGQKAKRTWVFRTDAKGGCVYDDAEKVSGDELYRDSKGNPALPLGTVTIQETKAPEGYHRNPEVLVRQITAEGSGEQIRTYQMPKIAENVLQFTLVKYQQGTDIVLPGTRFEHTKPDGSKELLVSDERGILTCKGLQYGTHTVVEIAVMDGYLINKNLITFHVASDNQITYTSNVNELQGKITFLVNDEKNISVTVEDRLAPYTLVIHKKNHKNRLLAGAEFGIYSDKACEQEIGKGETDNHGVLKFQQLEAGRTYYLRETRAPKGYRLPLDAQGKFQVYEIDAKSVPVRDEFCATLNGRKELAVTKGTKAEREVHITIENQIGFRLPNTGSRKTMIMLSVGVGVCIISIVLSRKKMGGSI